MNYLTYIVPGLIPEGFSGTLPRLPYLERLLAHASVRPLSYRLMKEQCSAHPVDSDIAQLAATTVNLRERYPHWLQATPIHLHVEGDGLVLMDAHTFPITLGEAQSLIDTFNQHFLIDKIEFFALSATQWLIGSHTPLNTTMPHPLTRAGRTIAPYLPQGEEDKFWRRVFNETQMLCYEHCVNIEREGQQQKPIQGVWFWNNRTKVTLSQYHNLDQLESAAAYGDWEKWTEEITALDRHVFKDLYESLKRTKEPITLLATDHPNSREIVLYPIKPWKFWLRPVPLSRFTKLK